VDEAYRSTFVAVIVGLDLRCQGSLSVAARPSDRPSGEPVAHPTGAGPSYVSWSEGAAVWWFQHVIRLRGSPHVTLTAAIGMFGWHGLNVYDLARNDYLDIGLKREGKPCFADRSRRVVRVIHWRHDLDRPVTSDKLAVSFTSKLEPLVLRVSTWPLTNSYSLATHCDA